MARPTAVPALYCGSHSLTYCSMASQQKITVDSFTPVRRAQVGLGLAGFGAFLTIFPFGIVLAYFGLVLVATGAVVASSFQRKNHVWWWMLVLSSLLSLLAPVIATGSQKTGGLLALLAGVLIIVTVVYALPTGNEAP